MKRPWYAVLLTFALILGGCSDSAAPRELEEAAALVRYFTTPSVLSRSTFPVVLPEGTPRQFVSWLFSGMGTAEWPPTRTMALREFGETSVPGMPTLPDGIAYVHSKPDTAHTMQIVITWDDPRGLVIVEGYTDPKSEPVLREEYTLPKVTATNDLARITAQSYLEMGGSYQAF